MRRYDFEESIVYLVRKSARIFSNAMDLELRKIGVTVAQWYVLAALSIKNGITQKEIAEVIAIESSTIVPIIDVLEREGFVERRRDPADRRINRIYLVEEKLDSLWDSMIEHVLVVRRAASRDVSEADLETTKRVLRKAMENVLAHTERNAIKESQQRGILS